jgi:hypothetical protein
MSSQANVDELIAKLKAGNPTLETLEAARTHLKTNRFTRVSAKLFKLADKLRR